METHRRKADGRRVSTTAFKQEQVARVARQEVTIAVLAREVSVSPQLIRQWQRLITNGSATAVDANEEVVPVSKLRAAQQRIKELEWALGEKTMEIEILQAARVEQIPSRDCGLQCRRPALGARLPITPAVPALPAGNHC